MTEGSGGDGVMTQLRGMLSYESERCSAFHGGRRRDIPQTIEQHYKYQRDHSAGLKRRISHTAAGKTFKTGGMKTMDGEEMDGGDGDDVVAKKTWGQKTGDTAKT